MRNIYTKIEVADKLKSELKQIEIKKAQGVKIRAKVTWELESETCTKYFFKKLAKRKNADQAILSLKSKQNGKILKDQQGILTEVKTFMNNSMDKKTMSKSRLKSIITLR